MNKFKKSSTFSSMRFAIVDYVTRFIFALVFFGTFFSVPFANAAPYDFDGNGTSDVVLGKSDGTAAIVFMNGVAVSSSATILGAGNWAVTHVADFNGDGKADIVLRNADGTIAVWSMSGANITGSATLFNANSGWRVTHTADLNGDGKADLILKNIDGRVAVLIMNGITAVNYNELTPADSPYSPTHVGDFNGDGKADIVLKHSDGSAAILLMNGTAVMSASLLLGAGSPWSVSHVADLNGDGKADIIIKNTDGSVAMLLMNGTAVVVANFLLTAGSPYAVTHTGDFNGDGKADILIRSTDGTIAMLLMDGTTVAAASFLVLAGSTLAVVQVGDYNGDRKTDILLKDIDGSIVVVLMSGLTATASGVLTSASSGWRVVPPTESIPIVSGPPHAAQFISQSVPTTMVAGRSYSVSVTMRNTGSLTWTAANNFRLGSQNPRDNLTWGLARVNVPYDVSPGSDVTIPFVVQAPLTPGTYNFQWDMVHDGVTWFDTLTNNVSVTVSAARPLIGAIRYDGQGDHELGRFEERALGPNQWHFRLPFYATEIDANTVRMRMDSQAKMDQEIAYAKDAGIDYWVLGWVVRSQPTAYVLDLYLGSAYKNDVKLAILWNTDNMYDMDATYLASLFPASNYQKVLGGRPLVYIFDSGQVIDQVRPRIEFLKQQTMAAMSGVRPYIVVMGFLPERAGALADGIAADAVSSYVTAAFNGQSYASSAQQEQIHWNLWKDAAPGNRKIVPWVTAGWDPRPRFPSLNPQVNPPPYAAYPENAYGTLATPSELEGQLRSAIAWARNNSTAADANTVVLYSWNEFSEGGSVCPAIIPKMPGEPYDGLYAINRSYLDAIKRITSP